MLNMAARKLDGILLLRFSVWTAVGFRQIQPYFYCNIFPDGVYLVISATSYNNFVMRTKNNVGICGKYIKEHRGEPCAPTSRKNGRKRMRFAETGLYETPFRRIYQTLGSGGFRKRRPICRSEALPVPGRGNAVALAKGAGKITHIEEPATYAVLATPL